jgi:hypothetical protein
MTSSHAARFSRALIATALALLVASPVAAQSRDGGRAVSAYTSVHDANRNAEVNRDVNANANVKRDVAVHEGYYGQFDRWGHPIAAATPPTLGAVVATLPDAGCTSFAVGGVAYRRCGSTYYQPFYRGSTVQYVVVPAP